MAVDSLKLRQWFMPIFDKYCEVMGFDCSKGSGCGFDDKCPPSTICEGTGTTHECGGQYNILISLVDTLLVRISLIDR